MMRMAVGKNHVVDNLHAGGICAGVDLVTGELGPASNLGSDVRLGWIERHPDSAPRSADSGCHAGTSCGRSPNMRIAGFRTGS